MILSARDSPVTNDRIKHAIAKITCFRECAKDGDISIFIDDFIFLLISGVESVPLEAFVQLSYGEFVEPLYYIRQAISFLTTVELKAVRRCIREATRLPVSARGSKTS